jgi:iron complex outermembrane recepter protein
MLGTFRGRRAVVTMLYVGAVALGGCRSVSDVPPASATPTALKKLTLEELMNIEVTSVGRGPAPLSETAAAVQVITGEDIRRSGATTLAEALRLAPNLQVAQVNAHDWAITARGFNGVSVSTGSTANKLLVMIDGRSVYTPLFGGVFWDVQQVSLDDVDRIEVMSGPAGTLWGANAVNGVINVITKSAEETHGPRVSLTSGTSLRTSATARYGGKIGPDFSYRAYGQRLDASSTERGGGDAHDEWNLKQGGFRTDYRPSKGDSVTVQGDFYEGRQGDPSTAFVNGQNLVARWSHVASSRSDWVAQVYLDRTARTFPTAGFREELQTADFDFQYRLAVGAEHTILWGAGYRHMRDDLRNGAGFSFLPAKRTMRLASGFVQNEYTPTGKPLKLIVGTKLEHNGFSGLEVQPSARLAWTPPGRHMAWAAASRAVRSPTRLDTEISTPTTGPNPDFAAENVAAYEIGYRVSPVDAVSLSVAAFHNRYTDIRSINQTNAQPALIFANDQEATSSGVELSGAVQAAEWWRVRGGYTYLHKSFRALTPQVLAFSEAFEAQDPSNQIILQSLMDLPRRVQFDIVVRYVDELPATLLGPRIAPYATADVRLARPESRRESP